MLVEGERVGSKKNSPRIAKIKIGHSQFRHAGGGGGADGLGVSPGGGGLARLLMTAPGGASDFRRVHQRPDDAGLDGVDSDAGEQRPDVLREADCHQPAPFTARLAQCPWLAIWPPSTCRISPVMYGDDSRNRTPFTTSLTCPARPSGGSRPPTAS